jgi:hypothetical protein
VFIENTTLEPHQKFSNEKVGEDRGFYWYCSIILEIRKETYLLTQPKLWHVHIPYPILEMLF